MQFALLCIALAALLGATHAQNVSVSACLQDCITTSGSLADCSTTNVTCMCASSAFQADMLSCLNANCTAADLTQAKSLDAEFCTSS